MSGDSVTVDEPPLPSKRWDDAVRALRLFCIDPAGLGGVALRSRAGPVRDRWLAGLAASLAPGMQLRRLPPGIDDDRLLGGLDVAATLASGAPALARGLLAECDGGVLIAGMAERMPHGLAARIALALDSGTTSVERDGFARTLPARVGVILLDEGADDDERPPVSLTDRVAFHVDLTTIGLAHATPIDAVRDDEARARYAHVTCRDAHIEALCAAALRAGIASVRAPMLAVRAARAAAAIAGRGTTDDADVALAARLVLGPRMVFDPAPGGEDAEREERESSGADPDHTRDTPPLDDVVLAATRAYLPPELLATLKSQGSAPARAAAGRTGQTFRARARGRPAGTRAGDLRPGARLDLAATLRAAAPWQRLRGASPVRIAIRRDDLRIAHYAARTRTTAIFAVDASGSSALHRLAEAKGAVALLLADCYVRRESVALVAFRGAGAQVLLPPTRSLVRAKRCLATLPGGGGTPLAAGLDAAAAIAESVRARGDTPLVVVLTDGHANVSRDATGGRAAAERDALAAAASLRARGVTCLVIDTSPQPQAAAQRIAQAMNARYLALPYAASSVISRAVREARPG